jgi:hypothetical protein
MFEVIFSDGSLGSVAGESKEMAWQMAEYLAAGRGLKVTKVFPEGYVEPSPSFWESVVAFFKSM